MGYAGITGPDDLQQHGDPYFHYYSIQNILSTVESVNCGRTEILSSETLSVDAGQDYVIPIGTPYELKIDLFKLGFNGIALITGISNDWQNEFDSLPCN